MKNKLIQSKIIPFCENTLKMKVRQGTYLDFADISSYPNLFLANVPILYPLKTSENLWFSGVFRGCQMGTLARNGLINI